MAKKKKSLSPRQRGLIKHLSKGKSLGQAAIAAGYTNHYPAQAGHQALEQIRMRMPEILDQHGLTDHVLIDKYLRPLMDATETKFFAYRKDRKRKERGKEKASIIETVQVIDTREVINWNAREAGLDLAFKLKGSYATPAEAGKAAGPTVIVIDMPRPPRPAIDVSSE